VSERLGIELPHDLAQEQQDDLVGSLQQLDEVDGAKMLAPARSDAATISVGLQLAAQIGAAIGPVVVKVIEVIRRREITGVDITLPSGARIAVDEISAKDLEHLLEDVGEQTGR
jgi:hypothetical protein